MTNEAGKIMHHLTVFPDASSRTTIKVARELLLHGDFIARGRLYDFCSKHVGAGVYEITAKERNP